jgi:hypothetical protein
MIVSINRDRLATYMDWHGHCTEFNMVRPVIIYIIMNGDAPRDPDRTAKPEI